MNTTDLSKMKKTDLLAHLDNVLSRSEQEIIRLQADLDLERAARTPDHKVAHVMTVVMSFFIPAFCTCFSMIAGHSFEVGAIGITLAASIIVLLALSVSMPHLAHAVKILTHSSPRVSWCLAIAFDGGVVLSEVTRVSGPPALAGVALTSLILLMFLSAVLNFIAFRSPEVSTES